MTGMGSVRLISPPSGLQEMTYSLPDVKVNLVQPEANSVCEIGRLRDGQLGKFFVMFEGV
jgi:hypothetical protein